MTQHVDNQKVSKKVNGMSTTIKENLFVVLSNGNGQVMYNSFLENLLISKSMWIIGAKV